MKLTVDDVQKILEVCGNDGHSIVPPAAFKGVNPTFVERVTHTHRSNFASVKETIFKDGHMVPEATGVHTLSALAIAVDILGLPDDIRVIGRGFRARAYTHVLQLWVEAHKCKEGKCRDS